MFSFDRDSNGKEDATLDTCLSFYRTSPIRLYIRIERFVDIVTEFNMNMLLSYRDSNGILTHGEAVGYTPVPFAYTLESGGLFIM